MSLAPDSVITSYSRIPSSSVQPEQVNSTSPVSVSPSFVPETKKDSIPETVKKLVIVSTATTILAVLVQIMSWNKTGYKDVAWIALFGTLISGSIMFTYNYYSYKTTKDYAGMISSGATIFTAFLIAVLKANAPTQ